MSKKPGTSGKPGMRTSIKAWLKHNALFAPLILAACVQSPVKDSLGQPGSQQVAAVKDTVSNFSTNSAKVTETASTTGQAPGGTIDKPQPQATAPDAETQHKIWLAAQQTDKPQNDKFASITGDMISVPPGCFSMGGADAESFPNEHPVHKVCVKVFKLGKTEVSFAQYDRFAKATGRELPNDEGWGRGDRPVINISWHDAEAFTKWASEQTGLTIRLPSEAEWEYAARAGSTTKYSWGDTISCDQARFGYWDCNSRSTMPVASYQANPFGIFDMHGNVWEYVEDCFNHSYHGAPVDGSAWLDGDCSYRIVRGGSWNDSPGARRAAFRGRGAAVYRFNFLGFRLAQSL